MAPLTLYADFNNADAEGRTRLNGAGSLSDLARLGARLADGTPVTLYDEELMVDGEIFYSPSEGIWTARIDWSLVRNRDAETAAIR